MKWWRLAKYEERKHPKGFPLERLVGECCRTPSQSVAEGTTRTLERIVSDYALDVALGRKPVLPDYGVPSHDVFKRVSSRTSRRSTSRCKMLLRWLGAPSIPPTARRAASFGESCSGASSRSRRLTAARERRRSAIQRQRRSRTREWAIRVTDEAPVIPAAIETALRSLTGLRGCVVEGRPALAAPGWIVCLSLEAENAGALVPTTTRWCVQLDRTYPASSIGFYPASIGGLAVTFPHQERNEADRDGRGYRSGKLCLDSPFGELGSEPSFAIRLATQKPDCVGTSNGRSSGSKQPPRGRFSHRAIRSRCPHVRIPSPSRGKRSVVWSTMRRHRRSLRGPRAIAAREW